MLRDALLNVDGCIVAEDSEHLVLALRFEKERLRANHGLLLAISEHLSNPPGGFRERHEREIDLGGSYLPRPPKKRLRSGLAAFGAAFLMGMAPVFALSIPWNAPVTAQTPPPFEIFGARPTHKILRPGQDLEIEMTWRRNRLCLTTTDRLVARADGGGIVARQRLTGFWQAVTDYPVQVKYEVDLPDGLKPGQYLYRAYVHSECGSSDAHDYMQPDVPFEVIDAAAPSHD